MIEVGRIAVKTAGRDAGKKCIILTEENKGRVLIDGKTRRREINIKHIEPINQKVDIEEEANSKEVYKKLGIEEEDKEKEETKEQKQPSMNWLKDDLKQYAKDKQIEIKSSDTKKDILEKIQEKE